MKPKHFVNLCWSELEHQVAELESTVEESQAALAKMQELNGEYKAKVQVRQKVGNMGNIV